MASRPDAEPRRFITTVGPWLVVALSIPIGIYAYMFQIGVAGADEFHLRFAQTPLRAGLHILFGGTVLVIGGFQFIPALRNNYRRVHRWIGRLYLLCVLAGGTAGFALSFQAEGGLVGRFGFGCLAIVWLYTGWQAWRAIRRRDIATHRIWMMRNYALAFAAVTLRIQLGIFGIFDVPFEAGYPVTAWLSWIPNLLIVEWFLVGRVPAIRRGRVATADRTQLAAQAEHPDMFE